MFDVLTPAVALPRFWSILIEGRRRLLWTWLIVPVVLLGVLWMLYGMQGEGLGPSNSQVVLLLVVVLPLMIAYYAMWILPIITHLRMNWPTEPIRRIAYIPLWMVYLVAPIPLMLAMVESTSSTPISRGTFSFYPYALPLGALVVASGTIALVEAPRERRVAVTAALLGPFVGLHGMGHLICGWTRGGLVPLVLGALNATAVAVLATSSWSVAPGVVKPYSLINLGLYISYVAYALLWLDGMADVANAPINTRVPESAPDAVDAAPRMEFSR